MVSEAITEETNKILEAVEDINNPPDGGPPQGSSRSSQQMQSRGTFRGNNNRGGQSNQNGRGGQNNSESDKDKCRYSKKPGHMVQNCFKLQEKRAAESAVAVDENECHEEENDQEEPEVSGIFGATQATKRN